MATTAPSIQAPSSARPQVRRYEIVLMLIGLAVTLAGSIAIGATNYSLAVFVGIAAMLGSFLILLRPSVGLYVLFVFVFANLSDVIEIQFGIPDTNKMLVALIFVGTFASHVVLRKKPVIFRFTEIVILVYGTVIIASLIGAPPSQSQSTHGVMLVIDWLKDFAIMLIIVQFATDERVWERAQWFLILTAAILAAMGLYQMVTGDFGTTFYGLANAPVFQVTANFDSNRVTGPLQDPNFYGMMQLMVFPIAAYRFLTDPSPRNRAIGLVAALLILGVVLATYSRGALLALLVILFLIVRERRLNPYKIGSIVVLVVVLVIPLLPPGFIDRVSTLGSFTPSNLQMTTERSLRGRSSEAIVALEMFQDYPILGVGRGNYVNNYLDYSSRLGVDNRNEPRQAHNLYLELAAETGVLGLITFSAMITMLFVGMRRARRTFTELQRPDLTNWVTGIQYGLLAYLLASIFLHADYIRYFWLIIGLAASCSVLANAYQQRQTDPRIVSRISPVT